MSQDVMNFLWVEKYRPKELDQFVLSDYVRSQVKKWISDGIFPHLILHGDYGTGKTSLVKFLISKFDCDVYEVNASKIKGIDLIRDEITNFLNVVSFSKFKVVVFHEGENLTPQAQEALKEDLELNSDDTRIVFTTNHAERIDGALASRCLSVHVEPSDPKDVAERIKYILDKENVVVPDEQKQKLWKLVKDSFPDIRKVIKTVQNSVFDDGTLKLGTVDDFSEFSKIKDILSKTKKTSNKPKILQELRKIVNVIPNGALKGIYGFLFSNLSDIYNNEQYYFSVPVIARYQYQSSFDVDIEINVVAMLQELIELI